MRGRRAGREQRTAAPTLPGAPLAHRYRAVAGLQPRPRMIALVVAHTTTGRPEGSPPTGGSNEPVSSPPAPRRRPSLPLPASTRDARRGADRRHRPDRRPRHRRDGRRRSAARPRRLDAPRPTACATTAARRRARAAPSRRRPRRSPASATTAAPRREAPRLARAPGRRLSPTTRTSPPDARYDGGPEEGSRGSGLVARTPLGASGPSSRGPACLRRRWRDFLHAFRL